jgi:type I restriction enzyme S subunit
VSENRVRLGDVCQVIAGQSPEGRFYNANGNGMPFYQGKKEFTDRVIGAPSTWTTSTTKVAEDGDILMSVRAPVGPVNFCFGEACIGRGLAAIRPGSSANRDFIFHQLRSMEREIAGTEGAVFPSINKSQIEAIEIFLPPLDEQMAIVGDLDSTLNLCVSIRSNSNDRSRLIAKYMQSFVSQLLYDFTSSETVSVTSLDRLCEAGIVVLGRGMVISRKDLAATPGLYPVYSSAKENDGKFGEYGEYMFDEEMITWSIDGGGRLFFRPRHKFSVTNVGGTLRVIKPEILDTKYLHAVLQHLHSRRVFDWVAKAHPSVIRRVYDEIPVPELADQKAFVSKLEAVQGIAESLNVLYRDQVDLVPNLERSILQSAFRGEV